MVQMSYATRFLPFCRFWLISMALVAHFAHPAGGQLLESCIADDDGTGTASLPPDGCSWLHPQEVFKILDGLPPGTTMELTGTHLAFFCESPAGNGPCLVENGGFFGGQREVFNGVMVLEVRGTGDLDDFRRVLSIQTAVETQSAPRTPGDPVQAFDTGIFSLVAALPPGDPDFAQLGIVAGSNFGLDSFGHTTFTSRSDGTFAVDRFFNINYQVTFVGAPGGALSGLSGVTSGLSRMEARENVAERRCITPDDGSGTAALPPDGCSYFGRNSDRFSILNGLPPGSTLQLDPWLEPFVCTLEGGSCGQPGGILGGERQTFDSTLRLYVEGTGPLSDYRRSLRVPVTVETHSAPRTPGDPVQAFVAELFDLQGSLTGDPDFASFTLTAGLNNGMPSPGQTTLEDLGDGTFRIDSFFDIGYRIDFVGAPGGALEGFSGSTQAATRIEVRNDLPSSVESGNGNGTVTLPPETGQYQTAESPLVLVDGFPPGSSLRFDATLRTFFCTTPGCAQAGGNLGGEVEAFDANLDLRVVGEGSQIGFQRVLSLPATVVTHSAPRAPGDAVQRFDAELVDLQSVLVGDPDFNQLTITAGIDQGLASPGQTTLTDLGDGTYLVDSFFDITYDIDFVGAPGGALDGLSGSNTGEARLEAYDHEGAMAHNVTVVVVTDPPGPDDVAFTGDLGAFSLDDDLDPALGNRRTFNNLSAGSLSVVESASPDLILLSIGCEDPDGGTTVDLVTREAIVDLDLGEEVICTFRNAEVSTFIFADGFESGNTSSWSNGVP